MTTSPLRMPSGRAISLHEARSLGVSRRQWDKPSRTRLTRTVRRAQPLITLPEMAAAFALAMPRPFAFSHLTALVMHGVPLPEAYAEGPPLHVLRPSGPGRIERHGCVGHRGGRFGRGIGPAESPSWCPAASRGAGHDPAEGAVTDGDRTRLMFVAAGLPEPETGGEVTVAGGWRGEFDLVWREGKVIAEYQGAPHGSLRSRRSDRDKFRLVKDEEWRVFEVYAQDVYNPAARADLIRRIRAALES